MRRNLIDPKTIIEFSSQGASYTAGREKAYVDIDRLKFISYTDSLNKRTGGIGIHLDQDNFREILQKYAPGVSLEGLKANREFLNLDQVKSLFEHYYSASEGTARRFVGEDCWENLSEGRKLVLQDLAFNLGEGKLNEFKKFRQALMDEDFEKAARELKDSSYYHQVKDRGESNAGILKDGEYDPEIHDKLRYDPDAPENKAWIQKEKERIERKKQEKERKEKEALEKQKEDKLLAEKIIGLVNKINHNIAGGGNNEPNTGNVGASQGIIP